MADELVHEGRIQANADRLRGLAVVEFDEKNIRRRVYDAFNVLKALGAIKLDKKDITWKGLFIKDSTPNPAARPHEQNELVDSIAKKNAYLKVCPLLLVLKQNHVIRMYR